MSDAIDFILFFFFVTEWSVTGAQAVIVQTSTHGTLFYIHETISDILFAFGEIILAIAPCFWNPYAVGAQYIVASQRLNGELFVY